MMLKTTAAVHQWGELKAGFKTTKFRRELKI